MSEPHYLEISPALNADELEEQLDRFLDPVLSFRRSAALPAQQIASLEPSKQQFALHWVAIISATNAEFAYQYAASFSAACVFFKQQQDALQAWTIEAMQAYDERGLQFSCKILQNSETFAETFFKKQQGVVLEDKQKLLSAFVCGLNGRKLTIKSSNSLNIESTYTDTECIFLPEMIAQYPCKEDNFLFYKLLVVYHWAQNWFASWRYDLNDKLSHYPDYDKALTLFHCIESIRLIIKIKYELPGFFRQVQAFLTVFYQLQDDKNWHHIYQCLAQKNASIDDSLDLLEHSYGCLNGVVFSFQGSLLPTKVQEIKAYRLEEEKTRFREALEQMLSEYQHGSAKISEEIEGNLSETVFTLQIQDDPHSDNVVFELSLDGQIMTPPDNVQSLMSSIFQDIGEIPEEYLIAAGSGHYDADAVNKEKKNTQDVWSGVYHEEGAYFYDEWDHIRQQYKKNWCVVREVNISPIYDDFVSQTLTKNRGIVQALRRNFEALKGEEKLLKRQVNGDDIDIDALVESYAELSMGMELSEHVFTKMQREERNIAVVFMVDMSGSTKGWINQAEREALVLLCESLETLGDRYAIYGFSGTTRKRCEIYHIKHLEEDYSAKVKARISAIRAKDYTRMGFAIRHLSGLLEDVEAKTKLLITLSDGKPEDYDGLYRGEYGIEDTRQALFEARQRGIHVYCITIDKEAGDYLPHMYGAANYALIEDISSLPLKVSDIYRKLTT